MTMIGYATPSRRLVLAALATVVPLAAAADTGEFNTHDGVAIRGYDPVAYFDSAKPIAGSPQFTARYKSATFRFASEANRERFLAAPERYAPQYGGFCAYGTAGGYKADIDPAAWSIVDGKLYLNYSPRIRSSWNKDQAGYIAKADRQWPSVAELTEVAR